MVKWKRKKKQKNDKNNLFVEKYQQESIIFSNK